MFLQANLATFYDGLESIFFLSCVDTELVQIQLNCIQGAISKTSVWVHAQVSIEIAPKVAKCSAGNRCGVAKSESQIGTVLFSISNHANVNRGIITYKCR